MAGKSRSQRGGGNRRANRGRGGPGGGRSRSKRPATNRQYPRTARLNTLFQEIVADFFRRVDDERFEMLTVTGVEVDNDLNRAQVFVSALGGVPLATSDPELVTQGETSTVEVASDPDQDLLDALADYRKPVQAKIGREARIRKTPEVVFVIDPAVRSGARIDEILASINPSGTDSTIDDPDSGVDAFERTTDDPAGESSADTSGDDAANSTAADG